MIINKIGQTYSYDDNKRSLYVGQEVVANQHSAYAGFTGTITEIRDGADKKTENPDADIYCTFKLPVSDNRDYNSPIDWNIMCNPDMNLDCAIMAPYMLEPKMEYQVNARFSELFILSYYVDKYDDNEVDYFIYISDDRETLRKKYKEHRKHNTEIPDDAVEEVVNKRLTKRYIYKNDSGYFCYSIFPVMSAFKENWSVNQDDQ